MCRLAPRPQGYLWYSSPSIALNLVCTQWYRRFLPVCVLVARSESEHCGQYRAIVTAGFAYRISQRSLEKNRMQNNSLRKCTLVFCRNAMKTNAKTSCLRDQRYGEKAFSPTQQMRKCDLNFRSTHNKWSRYFVLLTTGHIGRHIFQCLRRYAPPSSLRKSSVFVSDVS